MPRSAELSNINAEECRTPDARGKNGDFQGVRPEPVLHSKGRIPPPVQREAPEVLGPGDSHLANTAHAKRPRELVDLNFKTSWRGLHPGSLIFTG